MKKDREPSSVAIRKAERDLLLTLGLVVENYFARVLKVNDAERVALDAAMKNLKRCVKAASRGKKSN